MRLNFDIHACAMIGYRTFRIGGDVDHVNVRLSATTKTEFFKRIWMQRGNVHTRKRIEAVPPLHYDGIVVGAVEEERSRKQLARRVVEPLQLQKAAHLVALHDRAQTF